MGIFFVFKEKILRVKNMKFSNKIIIAGAIACAFCLGLLSALFIRVTKTNFDSNKNKIDYSSIKTENNMSKTIENNLQTESYSLKLKGSAIYAYVILSDGTEILWNSTSVPPALSPQDKENLEKGITPKSFEELCLYFEAYSS